jgi:hypothetical protein
VSPTLEHRYSQVKCKIDEVFSRDNAGCIVNHLCRACWRWLACHNHITDEKENE